MAARQEFRDQNFSARYVLRVKKKAPRPSATRPTALVRAEHDERPLHLDAAEHDLLGEALRRGEDLREDVEAAVTAYGRWLLGAVFHDDAAAALDAKTKNAVWAELVRRAGGPTLRVGRRMLYVAVTIAANDKRITDQAWRGLDGARKELLLPIRSSAGLRDAAQHVSKFNLSQAKTREYVTAVLESSGRRRQVRLTGAGLVSRVRKLRESLGGAAVLRKVGELGHELPAAERRRAVDELDRLRVVLEELSRTLQRGR